MCGKLCLRIHPSDEICPYLAVDGTCLLPEEDLAEKCLALKKVEDD